MRTLVVLPVPPDPEGSAIARCAVGLLRAAQAAGIDCHALAAYGPAEPIDGIPPDLPVEPVAVTELPEGWSARLERLVRPGTVLGRGSFARRFQEAVEGVELVHLLEAHAAACAPLAPCPVAIEKHFLIHRDGRVGAPWRREAREMIAARRMDRRTVRQGSFFFASSPEVAAEIARHGKAAYYLPLALDPAYYPYPPPEPQPAVGMIGAGHWPPTAAAIARLVGRVWPELRRRRPEAQLLIAGRRLDPGRFPGADQPGVRWVGAVERAAEFIRGLAVLLYPLPAGSGLKVKVLEALALGVPVVTTPEGAEGLASTQGVMVAEDDRELAAAAAQLLADPKLRQRLSAEARENFLRHHSPGPVGNRLADLYRRCLAAGAQR